jgi:glycosyltransferase involved in cell wall biosynthesis
MNAHCFAIPVYKDSKYLEECLDSILKQTIKSDIIICTSTPTEQNKSIAEKYNIPYFVNHTGETGIAADWNFAFLNAKTNLVTITHQDDIYEPMFAESAIKSFNKTTLISFTNYADIHGANIKSYSLNSIIKTLLLFPFLIKNKITIKFIKKIILSFGDPICCPSVTINKGLLPEFSFSKHYTCALDWHAWYQLANVVGEFVFINKKLVKHRIHEESETTNQIKIGKRQEEEAIILKQIWGKRIGALIAKAYKKGHLENKL